MTLLDRACLSIATGLHLSYIPFRLTRGLGLRGGRWTGAGLVGALWGWALVYALPEDPFRLGLALSTATVLAFAVCGRAERILQVHDDPRIVVDETVGFWVAVAGMPRTLPLLVAGLVLFRALDALKLPPFSRLERLPGGVGIVMDDVGAAVAANILLRGALALCPGAFA